MTQIVSMNGQIGSFHDLVFGQYFNDSQTPIYCDDFKQVFKNVVSGESDLGLVAIENSLYGSINEVDALLLETNCWIIGETYLRINFCILGHPDTKLDEVTDVYSQDIALFQCSKWLEDNLPNAAQHNIGDTAGAAKFVSQSGDSRQVALASANTAKLYGLEMLAEEVENDKNNFTRFVVITKDKTYPPQSNKTSIALKTASKPGALLDVLKLFDEHKINLTKLDSKPIAGKPWEYMFYIDFEAGQENPATQKLLKTLDDDGHNVHILGSYVAGTTPKS